MPEPVSSYAGEIDWLMNVLHVVMVGIFIVWSIYFVYCLVAYRAKNGHGATYHQTGEKASFIPDGLILAFEMWLILAFGIPIWSSVKQETPPPEESLVVNLIAQQFAWNFQYPGPDGKFETDDDKMIENDLHVPVNEVVRVRLTSKDVIHSFFVPQFRLKQDAVPGRTIEVWFKATEAGVYELPCAELCGFGHSGMLGHVTVQSAEDYKAWTKEQWPS